MKLRNLPSNGPPTIVLHGEMRRTIGALEPSDQAVAERRQFGPLANYFYHIGDEAGNRMRHVQNVPVESTIGLNEY